MTPEQLKLIVLITAGLKTRGYRYLAEEEDDHLVIRIFKGLDES